MNSLEFLKQECTMTGNRLALAKHYPERQHTIDELETLLKSLQYAIRVIEAAGEWKHEHPGNMFCCNKCDLLLDTLRDDPNTKEGE